jgi:hypothetical protein
MASAHALCSPWVEKKSGDVADRQSKKKLLQRLLATLLSSFARKPSLFLRLGTLIDRKSLSNLSTDRRLLPKCSHILVLVL